MYGLHGRHTPALDSADCLRRCILRIATIDIESWDLNGSFGPILCISVLDESSGEITTFRQDSFVRSKKYEAEDMTEDMELCVLARNFIEDYHLTIGYFSKGFDLAHIRTRLAKWEKKLLKKMLHIDGIWYFKGWRGLKPKSSKLKHVAEFLGIEPKPEVEPETWLKARSGNKAAMDIVCERCEADVRITKAVVDKALDLGLISNVGVY